MKNLIERWQRYWSAPLPANDRWTLAHTWRYGRDPAKTMRDERRYRERGIKPRPTPWLFR